MDLFVLLGPPGSGKGTQAQMLVKRHACQQISTGDLLRRAVQDGSELGLRVKSVMASGQLVSDEIVLELIERALLDARASGKPVIFDGFPRNVAQARALDSLLIGIGAKVSKAILFQIDDSVLVGRIVSRRTCAKCAAMYSLEIHASARSGVCENCGGALIQRDDDREDVVRKRLGVYWTSTSPVVDYYRGPGIVDTVTADGAPEEVFSSLCRVIGLS